MKLNLSNAWLQAGASISTYIMATNAMAAGTNIGDIATSFGTATSNFSTIASSASYVGGAFLGMKGMLSLKKHAENPGQESLAKGAGGVAMGAGLLGLPFIMNSILTTGGGDTSALGAGNVTTRF